MKNCPAKYNKLIYYKYIYYTFCDTIVPLAVIIGIAAIIITPIIIGSVTAGYLISYTLRDKTGEKCRFKIFNTNKLIIMQMKS